MTEIKSTMEIIMEKTKDLTMTEEEKDEFKRREVAGRIKGLVQRFLDGFLDLKSIGAELSAMGEEEQSMARRFIREESVTRIGLDQDNEPIFHLLESTTGMDTKDLKEAIESLRQILETKRRGRTVEMKRRLEARGISGTAVFPNLAADQQWAQILITLDEALQQEIAKISR
jgi:hypothetical protein